MKNLFNNLTEEEKRAILEQHYQTKENVDEQLGQRVKAGVQGAAQKVADVGKNIGKAVTGGVNRAPDIDANHQKLQSWAKWMKGQIDNFKNNFTGLKTSTTSSKNAAIPVYKGQVNMITTSIDKVLPLLPSIEKELDAIIASKLPDPEKGPATAAPTAAPTQQAPVQQAPVSSARTPGTLA